MRAKRYWTSYWREQNWTANTEYEPLGFSGGSFERRGVARGDAVYIISQRSGQLLLGGRLIVEEIISRDAAVRCRGRSDLYPAKEWVVARVRSGTPLHHRRQLAPEITKLLRFMSRSDATAKLLFVNDRELDRQTTRSVRELAPESASLLDEILELTDKLPRSTAASIISNQVLNRYRTSQQARDGH
jgi:hypothetical protein